MNYIIDNLDVAIHDAKDLLYRTRDVTRADALAELVERLESALEAALVVPEGSLVGLARPLEGEVKHAAQDLRSVLST